MTTVGRQRTVTAVGDQWQGRGEVWEVRFVWVWVDTCCACLTVMFA